MNEQLVQEYLAAFKAANPGKTLPALTYNRGWYRFGEQPGFRETRLVELRDNLLRRVEAKR